MFKHTYLLKEGTWEANGKYTDHLDREFEVLSESKILHLEDHWVLEGYMELLVEDSEKLLNAYNITPIKKGEDQVAWTVKNPSLGTLSGKFLIVGDTIMSVYNSEDGTYSGFEVLTYQSPDEYLQKGYSMYDGKKLSSWEAKLKRVEK